MNRVIPVIVFFSIPILLGIIFHARLCYLKGQIKTGQLYAKVYYKDNPFKTVRIDTIEILEVKEKYFKAFQYRYQDTITGEIDYLVCCLERIN